MLGHSQNGAADELLDTLSHPIRRRLLFSLYEQNQGGSELPLHRVSGLAFEEENTLAALYQKHLPKLEAKGYVRCDSGEHTIPNGPEWVQIEPLLRLVHTHLYELPRPIRGTRSTP